MIRLLLAIDVGNSHTSLGLFSDGTLSNRWRLSTRLERTSDELRLAIAQCLNDASVSFRDLSRIGISSVVPSLTPVLAEIARREIHSEPLIVSAATASDIRIEYRPPEAVGADRICDAVAGYRKFGGPLIIVDLGTATVFDVILEGGIYKGGVIAPGLSTAAESLHSHAAMLPLIEIQFPKTVVGETTKDSIQSGIVYGALEMIDGIVRRIQSTLPRPAHVIATGGFASLLFGKSETIQHVEPDLVLEGIRILMDES